MNTVCRNEKCTAGGGLPHDGEYTSEFDAGMQQDSGGGRCISAAQDCRILKRY